MKFAPKKRSLTHFFIPTDADQILSERAYTFAMKPVFEVLGFGGFKTLEIDKDSKLSQLLGAFGSGTHHALVATSNGEPFTVVSQSDFINFLYDLLQKV